MTNRTVDTQYKMNIQPPVVHGEVIYSGSLAGGGLVQLKADRQKVTAEPVYFSRKLPSIRTKAVMWTGTASRDPRTSE